MYSNPNYRIATDHAKPYNQSAPPHPENNLISRMWG